MASSAMMSSLISSLCRNLLYIFAAADIEIYNGIVIADEYLAYKVIYNLLLIVLVVDVAFQEFVYKVEQPLPFPVRRERSHRKIITYMFFC